MWYGADDINLLLFKGEWGKSDSQNSPCRRVCVTVERIMYVGKGEEGKTPTRRHATRRVRPLSTRRNPCCHAAVPVADRDFLEGGM